MAFTVIGVPACPRPDSTTKISLCKYPAGVWEREATSQFRRRASETTGMSDLHVRGPKPAIPLSASSVAIPAAATGASEHTAVSYKPSKPPCLNNGAIRLHLALRQAFDQQFVRAGAQRK